MHRKLPSKVYPLPENALPEGERGIESDSIVLPVATDPPAPRPAREPRVFSLKLHPPQKYHCSNIQNGDVHCGTLEWAQCGSCVAARACCDLQLVRDDSSLSLSVSLVFKIGTLSKNKIRGFRADARNLRYRPSNIDCVDGGSRRSRARGTIARRVKDGETWVSLNDNERATTLKWSFIHKSSSSLQITL